VSFLGELKRRNVFRVAGVYAVVGRLLVQVAAAIRIGLLGMLPLIGGCIGDLPPADYSCLAARGEYDRYNEVYVFSPRGEKKQQALMRAREAEQTCAAEQGAAAPTRAADEP
jgi:hypothetical protein